MLRFFVVSFFVAAALTADLAGATNFIDNADYCSWLGKVPIADMNLPTPGCMDTCGRLCIDNPGQYFCSGAQAFVDTAKKKYDVGDAAK
jgi:hypothetical protein